MNTRKIKVKLVDRPATLLCSFFGILLGKQRADRDGKNIWGFMLTVSVDIVDRDIVRKRVEEVKEDETNSNSHSRS